MDGWKLEKKIIGVVGPDLLLSSGGAINHSTSVMSELRNDFKFIFLPNPYFMKKFKNNRQLVLDKIQKLGEFQIEVPHIFLEALENMSSVSDLVEGYSQIHMDALFDFDYHFPLEIPDFPNLIARKTGLSLGVCLQGLSDYPIMPVAFLRRTIKLLLSSGNFLVIMYSFYQYLSRLSLVRRISRSKQIRMVLTVNNQFERNVRIRGKEVHKLYPGNGFLNPETKFNLPQHGLLTGKRNNKIIFFARLSYGKGIFDLKSIIEILFRKGNFAVTIIGRFDHAIEERLFKRHFSRYLRSGLVKYKGYVRDDDLYQEIANSKLMVYPSHSDTYSIAVMQALAMNTPVVAYDIPGLSIYKDIKAVRLVREFDYKSMADEALSLLKMENVSDLFDDHTRKFIEEHTWHKVALQYKKYFTDIYL